MKTLISANKAIKNFLGQQNLDSNAVYRQLKYIISEKINDDILVFNLLTKEFLILDNYEFSCLRNGGIYCSEFEKLVKKWFLVPEKTNDFILQTQLNNLFKNIKQKDYKDTFLIFTTTDCNARCYYCFESGCTKISMSEQTAEKVAEYIINESKCNFVNIQWFGGEPLYNEKVIDIISEKLTESGIEFKSSMTSNGFLFNKENIRKSIEVWHLKDVQITLDGTEEIYNKIKRYIYNEASPFKKVWDNIGELLENGIDVCIRYNMDMYNEKDLYTLTDDLIKEFGKFQNFSISAQIIMEHDNIKHKRSHEQNIELYKIRDKMFDYLERQNVLNISLPPSRVFLNRCMADNDSATTILPDGSLGKCATYTDDDKYGNIYCDLIDYNIINSYKKRKPVLEKCKDCPFFPNCIELEKCPSEGIVYCDSYEQNFKISQFRRSMRKAYFSYLKKCQEDDRK